MKFTVIFLFALTSLLNARMTCSHFHSWEDAQAYFKAKKPGYKGMDRDHDGEACESLRHKRAKREAYLITIYQKDHMSGFGAEYPSKGRCQTAAKALKRRNSGNTYKCVKKSSL